MRNHRIWRGMLNPLIASLPEPLVLPLDALPELAPTLELLSTEAFADSPGRQAATDRLFEYLFVLLIRSAMNAQLIDNGILMGLSDSRLSRAIEAMHQHPETSWSLEELAQLAGHGSDANLYAAPRTVSVYVADTQSGARDRTKVSYL